MTPTEILTIRSSEGHQFHATLYSTAQPEAPVLLFLPALGTPVRVYHRFAESMADCGVRCCIPDWRGVASSNLRAARQQNWGYRELVESDVTAVVAELGARLPGCAVWIGGHSLGGQLSSLLAARRPDAVRGLVLVASGSVFLRAYSPLLQAGIRALGVLAAVSGVLLGYFPGQRVGFGGREARAVMQDWLRVARTGHYAPTGSTFDYETALRRLTLPVLALNFRRDTWAPAAAARVLLDKMPACAATTWNWNDADTAGQPVDHFSWLRQPATVAPAVAGWMRQHCPGG